MTSFIHKKLSSNKSLSEIVKDERQKRKLSQQEVSSKTQIALDYLEKLEQGDYQELPGDVYIRQFIKRLSKFFNFSEKNLLGIYLKEKESQLNIFRPNPIKLPKRNLLFFLTPKFLRTLFIGVIIIGLFGYLAWEVKNIFTPPFLEIYSPTTQTTTLDSSITIKGRTSPEATVLINQQEILIKPDGSFSQDVDLNIGLNLFEISSSKKHSKESIVTISILRQPATASDLKIVDRFVALK